MRYIVIIVAFFCNGCALFQKTTRTSNSASKATTSQLESNQLALSRAGKETQIFTYWNDSGIYQYQHIKEQVDQAKSVQLKLGETEQETITQHIKKKEPITTWIYVFVLCAFLTGCMMLYGRIKNKQQQ